MKDNARNGFDSGNKHEQETHCITLAKLTLHLRSTKINLIFSIILNVQRKTKIF